MFLIAVVAAAAVGGAHVTGSSVFAPPTTISRPVSAPAPISRSVSPLPPLTPDAQKPHLPLHRYWYSGLDQPNEPLADCYARERAAALADLSGFVIAPAGAQCPPLLFPY